MKSDVKIAGDRLQITRVFDAPRHRVFRYWSQADTMQLWSGCKEATQCEIRMDFRVGGSFTQTMHIAGAGEFSITGIYDEIVVPERIVYRATLGPARTRVVVEFIEEGAQTKVVLTQTGFPDEFSCKQVHRGTLESLEKLEALLAETPAVVHTQVESERV